ncbi:LCA5L protein, partial [Sapayoa aenigma]|nr:LCA5L protein [Sapayoa aenigma]
VYSAPHAGGKTFPAAKAPELNSSFLTPQSSVNPQDKNTATRRVSSARLRKVKELKNQIFDLQRKIEASNLENHALRQLQSRQERAINRYKSAESNLQNVLSRHYEEMRGLRKLLRVSQRTERNMSSKLRKVEAKLLKAKDALQNLLVLSEDKDLAEREELNDRLSILTEELEEKDERIQSLEMQLKVNQVLFSRQLASENKKALQAGIITKNLEMEINSLQQKIKEKDRQLYIKNIYTNRMPRVLKGRRDSVPQEQSRCMVVFLSWFFYVESLYFQKSVNKHSLVIFTFNCQLQENPSEDKDEEAAANGAYSDAQSRTENQSTKKILLPQTSNRKHRDFDFREGRVLMEQYAFSEIRKEKEKEPELLKQQLETLMKSEPGPQSDSVKHNNQEGGAVEGFGKEERQAEEKQNNSEKTGSEGAAPKKPTRLKKKYKFSEAIENLHHGLHTTGTKPKAGSQRQAGQGCSETPDSRGKNSSGLQEPSLGKATKARPKDGAQGCDPEGFTGRRKQLMEELLGTGAVRRDNQSSSRTGMKMEK